MIRLSDHKSVAFYDTVRVINIHELRYDFRWFRDSFNTCNINLKTGSYKPIKGSYQPGRSHQLQKSIDLHLKEFYSYIRPTEIRLDIQPMQIKSSQSKYMPGNCTILCVTRDNLSGGMFNISDTRRELSQSYMAAFSNSSMKIEPIESFDSRNEFIYEILILQSEAPPGGPDE